MCLKGSKESTKYKITITPKAPQKQYIKHIPNKTRIKFEKHIKLSNIIMNGINC